MVKGAEFVDGYLPWIEWVTRIKLYMHLNRLQKIGIFLLWISSTGKSVKYYLNQIQRMA